MGRKAITIEQLRDEVQQILNDYELDVEKVLEKTTKVYAKIAVRELRQDSPVGKGTPKAGAYSKGWGYKYSKKKSRMGSTIGTVTYNYAAPSLTHLLEHGHALRQGGRSPAITHIKPVEESVTKEFESTVIDELEDL